MVSTNGPGPGTRTAVEQARKRAQSLDIEGHPGLRATPEMVARLQAALMYLKIGAGPTIFLNLGDGVVEYAAGDIEQLISLAAEAFQRYDTVGWNGAPVV